MKAIIYNRYGQPDVLRLAEVPTPLPKEDEVLVKVRAASVNSWDWDMVTGKPPIYRLIFGLIKPKYPIVGSDIAGEVINIGSQVTQFRVGDEVFGDISGIGFGAFAQYVCAPANLLALKAPTMTFEQAAAIPQAGVLALQGLRQGQLGPGKKVLINGAGGGTGTFAIQLAKLAGAEVTGVDRADKLDLMRSLGADEVLDYRRVDFTQTGQTYDLILDLVARHPMADCRRAMKSGGHYVIVGGKVDTLIKAATLGRWSKTEEKQISILMHKPNPADLHELSVLVEAGSVVPVIDKVYPLEEVAYAVRDLGAGDVLGKIVITI